MWDSWVAFVFGWPAIAASLLLFVGGMLRKKPVLLVIAAITITPFSLYLAATPRFRWFGLAAPLLFVAAAVALRRRREWLAWLFLVPFVVVAGWLAVVVLNEPATRSYPLQQVSVDVRYQPGNPG